MRRPMLPRFSTEQLEGLERGLGYIDIVYADETNQDGLRVADLASSDYAKQRRALDDLIAWAKDRPADLFVFDDGISDRFQDGPWKGKTRLTRWALDPTWNEPGALKIDLALAVLEYSTGRPWAVYGWGQAPRGASAVYVACHNNNRDRWFAQALATSRDLGKPIVAQVCPWRLIGAPPHPWLELEERAALVAWMRAKEAEAEAAGVKVYWSVWTAEDGRNPQNAQEPRMDAAGVVELTVQTWAGMD